MFNNYIGRVFYSMFLPIIVIIVPPGNLYLCKLQSQDRRETTREDGLSFHFGGVKSCLYNVI